jgi:integrase
MAKLSKTTVESVAPGAARRFLWDDTLLGFGVCVHTTGRRVYIVQYRNAAGRSRRLTLGTHGRLTVDQARKLAAEKLVAVAAGRDPAAERREAREQGDTPTTLEQVSSLWLDYQRTRIAKGALRARTLREYERQLSRELLPRLGRRRLAELLPADAQALQDALAGRPVLANRVLDLLTALWRWAESRGLASGPSPCRTVEHFREERRQRHLSHDQLVALGDALRRLTVEHRIASHVAPLVRLIALTGCRPGEVKRLAWADVDLARHVLHLRDAKTGDRDVWASRPALEVLEGLRAAPRKGDLPAWVFATPRDPSRPVGEFRKPWTLALQAAGIEPAPPYILRHTFASESEALGHSVYLTAELLGHSIRRRDMTRGYVHHIPEEVRRASERVGERIAAALDGKAGAPSNVVAMRA